MRTMRFFHPFVLNLIQNEPSLSDYIISTIVDTLQGSHSYCGYNDQDLLYFLSVPSSTKTKFSLLFAHATINPEFIPLHENFHQMFNSITSDDELLEVLFLIHSFAENTPRFFLHHLEYFIKMCCQFALYKPKQIRIQAIAVFAILAESEQEMCRATPLFYQPVIQTLLSTMTEIDDNASWTYDSNKTEPYIEARIALRKICESIMTSDVMKFIGMIVQQGFAQNNLTWQQMYAILSLLNSIRGSAAGFFLTQGNASPTDTDSMNFIRGFTIPILNLLANPDVNPRIRIVVYGVFISFCNMGPNFIRAIQNDFSHF